MNRLLFPAAFAVGLLAVLWVGAGYLPGHPLALSMVLLIAAGFVAGAWELHRYRQATHVLAQALTAPDPVPAERETWLARLPESLRPAVRLRLDGERAALPGPSLTPYLVGLLVLLGMLGTFLGMVVTLQGTGTVLERATDAALIREALVAPVKGLGLAFGTSVAGVAASAMLGLMSALARRERQLSGQQLDTALVQALRPYTRAQRQADERARELQLLQSQSDVLPALVTQVQALVGQTERQHQALHERLLASQAEFQQGAQRAYTALAESVDRTLQHSLTESARLAGAAIEPAVLATLAGLAREGAAQREALGAAVQLQLEGTTARLDASTATLAERWQTVLAEQQRQIEALAQQLQATLAAHTRDTLAATGAGLEAQAATLLQRVGEAHATWDAALATRERERMAAFHEGLTAATQALQREQQQISQTLAHTAQAVTGQAEAQARATIDEVARLVQAASEAPRAAAEVIGSLRSALSDSLARDNAALEERTRLLGTLGGLLDAVNHASTEQRQAVDALVRSATEVLGHAGQRLSDTVDVQAQALQSVAAQLSGSAAQVGTLGEGFGAAVDRFGSASEHITAQLQRIEAALGQTLTRSDEQLAYYVAQAREIVDLTLGSQKQVIDDLQKLARTA